MNLTQHSFNLLLKKNSLFENNPKVAVATSGGPDSMALVFLVNQWIRNKKGSLIALIVDHQIRSDSSLEANQVSKYLSKFNIECKILKVAKNKINKKNMKEARENRFKKLNSFCRKKRILHLFVAHHLDDNIETFLLRKIAGSNFEGLRSIQDIVFNHNLQIIRPFLNLEKKNILQYNIKNNIFFVKDPSNYNLKYSRSSIRDFLLKNKKHKNQILKDFKTIKKYFPNYRKMIFKILHLLTIRISKRNISIKSINFFKYDQEIQIKIIELIYRFLMPNRDFLRHKKISNSLAKLEASNESKTNLGGMSIKKDHFLINFSY